MAKDPAFHGLWPFWLQDSNRSISIYGAMLTPPLAAVSDDEELPPSRANGFCIEVRPGSSVSHLLGSLGVRHVADVRVYSLVSPSILTSPNCPIWYLSRRGRPTWLRRWKRISFVLMCLWLLAWRMGIIVVFAFDACLHGNCWTTIGAISPSCLKGSLRWNSR